MSSLNIKYVFNIILVHFVSFHVCIGEDVSKLLKICLIQLFIDWLIDWLIGV
jgi:hypothetical protein